MAKSKRPAAEYPKSPMDKQKGKAGMAKKPMKMVRPAFMGRGK